MNTLSRAMINMPYMPDPVPPGLTSPNIMLTSGTAPPSGSRLSWEQSTAPVEVPVVAEAKSPHSTGPKRVSLPSMLPPAWLAVTDLGRRRRP